MKSKYPIMSPRLCLRFAVALTVGMAVLVIAMSVPHWEVGGLISGAEGLVVYSVLGFFALHDHQWARWTLFAFLIGTALAAILFCSLDRDLSLDQNLGLGLLSALYGLVAVLIAMPTQVPGVLD